MKQTRKNRIRNTRKISKRPTWGYHLTVDARDCDPEAMRSKSTIAAFSKELVDAIDMVAYGPPQIVMFGNGYRKGYTLVQLIETSNIAAHFVEETNDIYLDIFSCKQFKVGDGIAVFQKYFKPSHINKRFITRRA
jgi:S-adenosylmethionine/arginine decarboxylase-like enzyme